MRRRPNTDRYVVQAAAAGGASISVMVVVGGAGGGGAVIMAAKSGCSIEPRLPVLSHSRIVQIVYTISNPPKKNPGFLGFFDGCRARRTLNFSDLCSKGGERERVCEVMIEVCKESERCGKLKVGMREGFK